VLADSTANARVEAVVRRDVSSALLQEGTDGAGGLAFGRCLFAAIVITRELSTPLSHLVHGHAAETQTRTAGFMRQTSAAVRPHRHERTRRGSAARTIAMGENRA
jgi:hypothetical protein